MTQEHTPATPYDAEIAALRAQEADDIPSAIVHAAALAGAISKAIGYRQAIEDAQPYREAVQALVEAATIVEQFSNEHPFTGIGNARTHTGYGMMHVDLIDALAGIRKIQEGA